MKKSTIGITIGDPGGIGPEVTLKALRILNENRWDEADLVVYGDKAVLEAAAGACLAPLGIPTTVPLVDMDCFKGPLRPEPCEAGGRAALVCLNAAVEDAAAGVVDAIVTAPLSKEAARMALPGFIGHTEFLGRAFGVERPVMMMSGGGLRVALVTTHCAVRSLSRLITRDAVYHTILAVHDFMRRCFGMERPRIAVCGLNPHPTDATSWTKEDRSSVLVAVMIGRAKGVDCWGPLAADTVFYRTLNGQFDAVVAMYHDQGLAAVKTIAFDTAVNITLGLPIVRTSPGHGTAFEIAGRGTADPRAMVEAIKTAAAMLRATGRPRNRTGRKKQ